MIDVSLKLGALEFAALQIPNKIGVGGSHQLVRHTLIGGVRIINAMGRDDRDVEWSGYFTGPDAVIDAQSLDALRIGGQPQTLTWDQFSFQVIVRTFEFDYEAPFRVPYRIVCEVVSENTTSPAADANPDIDDALAVDFNSARTLVGGIGDPTLTNLNASLAASIDAVPSFANAPQSALNSVLQPLAAMQTQIDSLIEAGNASIAAAPGFAGITVGANFGDSAIALSAQIGVVMNLSSLYQLRNVCGRMANNLGAVYASDASITVAGGNLFQIASQQYGDPMEWTTLAKANDLTDENGFVDPTITGLATLSIPAQLDDTDGVLQS